MYELLTGRPPYEASTLAELVAMRRDSDPVPPSALAPGVPAELDSLVLCCLLDDPELRPAAQDVARTLRGELEAPTRVVRPASELPTAILRRSRAGRRRGLITAVVAGLIALAVALGFGLGGGAAGKPKPSKARVAPIPSAPTAAGEAENLARWLRAHAG
jgi:hypothetical protein